MFNPFHWHKYNELIKSYPTYSYNGQAMRHDLMECRCGDTRIRIIKEGKADGK